MNAASSETTKRQAVLDAISSLGSNASLDQQLVAIANALGVATGPLTPKAIGDFYAQLHALGLDFAIGTPVQLGQQTGAMAKAAVQQATGTAPKGSGPWWWPDLPNVIDVLSRQGVALAIALAGVAGGIALMAGGTSSK